MNCCSGERACAPPSRPKSPRYPRFGVVDVEAKCCHGRFMARRFVFFRLMRLIPCPWCGFHAVVMDMHSRGRTPW